MILHAYGTYQVPSLHSFIPSFINASDNIYRGLTLGQALC